MPTKHSLYFWIAFALIANARASSKNISPEERCAFFPKPVRTFIPKPGFRSLAKKNDSEIKSLLGQIQDLFQPALKERKSKLLIQFFPDDPQINAYAHHDESDNSVIDVYGGLTRHPEITSDAVALIVCHEIGHFLGGAPKSKRGSSEKLSWSTAEGQADYFSTSKCLRKVFVGRSENEAAVRSLALKPDEQDALNEKCKNSENPDQCVRIQAAGLAAGKIFATVTGQMPPDPLHPDPREVSKTDLGHPSPQCRFDTFVSGSICEVSPTVPFDDQNPEKGACVEKADPGIRPGCWFSLR